MAQPAGRDSRWYVSSLELDVELAARSVRDHWQVENQLHWVLDVVFREDELKVQDPNGAAPISFYAKIISQFYSKGLP